MNSLQGSNRRRLSYALAIVFGFGFMVVLIFVISPEPRNLNPLSLDFWFTPDQQGDRLMRRNAYAEAAKRYRDPVRIGAALYRAGEFEEAAQVFGRTRSPEGQFNRGNALVMQGKYAEAVEDYEAALAAKPDWREAEMNRELARLRAEKMKKEGGDMTGGMLAADEIVFSSGKNDSAGQEETVEGGDAISNTELQALWLRRIQTKPADFLKAKFAYQVGQEDGK
jgi:Ca-activated chloride channel family protein